MQLQREEFEKLALEQMDMLYRIAQRLTHDRAAAEDLVQETYLRAFSSAGGFELREFGIRPWLLRIMHNLNATRAERERKQPRGVANEQLDGPAPREAPPLHDFSLWQQMDQQLVWAFNTLPMEYQEVLLLWAIDELSYKEIANAVGVPLGTVMSRLHRARQRLAEQLQDYARREGIIRPPASGDQPLLRAAPLQ